MTGSLDTANLAAAATRHPNLGVRPSDLLHSLTDCYGGCILMMVNQVLGEVHESFFGQCEIDLVMIYTSTKNTSSSQVLECLASIPSQVEAG